MRVTIDQQKCNGAGICVQELPELFRFQPGSKKSIEIVRKVPSNVEKKLVKIAGKCPVGAIILLVE